MLLEGVRGWLGGGHQSTDAARSPGPGRDAPSCPQPAPDVAAASPWSAARIVLSDQLWGEGFLYPGGEGEILRLARPLGLTSGVSLFVVGAGSGGAPRSIASQLGVRVTGFESDPDLAAIAAERCTRARLGGRAQVEMWYPESPRFHARAFHHGIALEPLRGEPPEPVLAALIEALRPAGQLVLVQMTADEPLDLVDPVVAAWRRIDRRPPALPTERGVTRMLGRLGLDARVVEDITERYVRLAMLGWKRMLAGLRERPPAGEAAALLAEAELWLLRLRLMQEARVRMVRWHAYGGRAAANLPT